MPVLVHGKRAHLDINTNKRGNGEEPHESQTQPRSRKGCMLLKKVNKIVAQHVFTYTRKITACLPIVHPTRCCTDAASKDHCVHGAKTIRELILFLLLFSSNKGELLPDFSWS